MPLNTVHPMLCVAALLCLSGSALAVGNQSLDRRMDNANRHIEQRAERALERAQGRQLDAIEQRIHRRAERIPDKLPAAADRVKITSPRGHAAFHDVTLETGFRAVERQWMATVTASDITQLEQAGVTIIEQRELAALDMHVVRFRVPPALDSLSTLQSLFPDLAPSLDRNHIYSTQSGAAYPVNESPRPTWSTVCDSDINIGMVDTAIDANHPVFADATVIQQSFLTLDGGNDQLTSPTTHGTAVAGLMIGRAVQHGQARLPNATLFNASVFYEQDEGLNGATLGHLLEGLNWLAEQQVAVINISLAGPANRLLEVAMVNLHRNGIGLVAAVGNEGPAAGPLYPAAYQPVIGVTAVDDDGQLYRWANRGDQVNFAARGVNVPVAQPGGGFVMDSGTSLAAPVVSAALACELDAAPLPEALQALISRAQGPANTSRYGHGLLML